jgi:hypothetical protein
MHHVAVQFNQRGEQAEISPPDRPTAEIQPSGRVFDAGNL